MNILIDDDKYQHMSWMIQAKKQQKDLRCFFSINDFLEQQDHITKNAHVFIDSDLKSDLPGELAAKKIYELGFVNITLVTSYQDIDLTQYPWLQSIRDKKYCIG